MSASVISDPVPISSASAEQQMAEVADGIATAAAEVEFVKCYCCSLTEECTPAYIGRVRERYKGRWICGLCAEAVKDEICRSGKKLIGTEEALDKHMTFCASFRSSPAPVAADANEHLIAAMRQLLRRSLDSPRGSDPPLTAPGSSSPARSPPPAARSPGPVAASPPSPADHSEQAGQRKQRKRDEKRVRKRRRRRREEE
ncbi:unnamed protein product [Spirodela intermedia]|uniref:Uncharacterized protein n=1 Tax=Spirodela intermedia TaxID=51605 RepID=A0A7I8J326_SPIIN|nr:unnamed protein product [Spirodela intermedia]CAA6664635.1 unnamed protein product [Spirodela intermedia]